MRHAAPRPTPAVPPATQLPGFPRPMPNAAGPCPSHAEASVPHVEGVWLAGTMGHHRARTTATGWPELDAVLPGGGWPHGDVVEVLCAQPSVCEWQLVAQGVRGACAAGGMVVLIGPPKTPHLPGLAQWGLPAWQICWLQCETPAERLWAAEQLVKADAAASVLAWLPQARAEQVRRLQLAAQRAQGLTFLFRPALAWREASAAPLRLGVAPGEDWQLRVDVHKRRGPPLAAPLRLASVPAGLERVLTARTRRPSTLRAPRTNTPEVTADVVGRPVATGQQRPLVKA